MNIVLFSHPSFLGSQSMPRFTRMLAEGLEQRGHSIKIWSPQPRAYHLPAPAKVRKWLGYIDQYIIFPLEVRRWLKRVSQDTLFVFTDHALGPLVPLVADRHHVIHCHDFLAQRSALEKIPENPTGWTGRLYQAYIRNGFSQGRNFISVSHKTQDDLYEIIKQKPLTSNVILNGLNGSFIPKDIYRSRAILSKVAAVNLNKGYILHVGGNDWYKNRIGVITIYNAWRQHSQNVLPLLMVGNSPSSKLLHHQHQSIFKDDIHWLCGLDDEMVRVAYSGASVLLFPSIAEGFGWPIAEAMASGCPVITTNEAPMTEVAGTAGFTIPRFISKSENYKHWAFKAARVVEKVVTLTGEERGKIIQAGITNAQRFNTERAIGEIEKVYQHLLESKG